MNSERQHSQDRSIDQAFPYRNTSTLSWHDLQRAAHRHEVQRYKEMSSSAQSGHRRREETKEKLDHLQRDDECFDELLERLASNEELITVGA